MTFMKNNRISLVRRRMMLSVALACGTAPIAALAGSFDDFFKAIQLDDASAVKSLLQRGFDPNTIENVRGDTGLIMALRDNSVKVVEVLLNAPKINYEIRSRNGDTALMIAAYKGNKNVVKAMLEKGAEANQTGWTALHYAAAVGDNDIVKILLEHSAYLDAESPNKTTPMMMAARAGKIMTVKLLLDEGADATLKNDQGLTAIDLARRHDHADIADGLTYQLKKAGKL